MPPDERSFWEFLDRRVQGLEEDVPWFVNVKDAAYRFLDSIDVPRPQVYAILEPDEIDELGDHVRERCVIKPTNDHSSAGVFPVFRLDDDRVYDLLRNRVVRISEIERILRVKLDESRHKATFRIMVEELFIDETPAGVRSIAPDFKFYAFRDGVGLILRIDRNPAQPCFTPYDEQLEIISAADLLVSGWSPNGWNLADVPAPPELVGFIPTAARIVRDLGTNFCSVDTYLVGDRVVVGELTLAPGAPYYKKLIELNERFDRYLGSRL